MHASHRLQEDAVQYNTSLCQKGPPAKGSQAAYQRGQCSTVYVRLMSDADAFAFRLAADWRLSPAINL